MTDTQPNKKQRSILIINPNTTQSMTDGLKPLVDSLNFNTTEFTYFTAPSGVPSINNESDALTSAQACLPSLKNLLSSHSAFLICCYSPHPLVPLLRQELAKTSQPTKHITGIFEASIATSLQTLDAEAKFGIVSTGKQWEEILHDAVVAFLGPGAGERFAGTETTGLNADELHSTPRAEVDRRMKEATKRVLGKGAKAVCLGCAGMAGMDVTVREACCEALGEEEGRRIRVVDGVVSGVVFLEGALRAGL